MSASRITRFLKSLLAGATVIPPAASFLESSAISKGTTTTTSATTSAAAAAAVSAAASAAASATTPISHSSSLSSQQGLSVQSQGGLLRKPNTTGGNQRNSSSSNTNAILSGANSNLGALQEPPPSPLSVTAAALASTAGGHANALSSRNIVVSNVSYPANEPLEDRFDYKDYLGGGGGSGGGGGGVSGNSSSFSYSPTLLATVLDGHGGWQVADFARRTLLSAIETELENCPVASNSNTNNDSSSSNTSNQLVEEEDKFVNSSWHLGSALARAFARIDRSFLSAVKPAFELGFGSVAHVGACALAAAVTRDSIVIANAGDCRAVLGRIHSGPTAPPSAIGAPVYFFSPLSLSGDLSFNSISENSNENSFFDPSSHITRQWGTKNTTSTTTLETMKKSISSDIGTIWHQASSSTSSSFSNTTSSFSLPSQSTTSDILPTTSSSSISSSLLSPPSSSSLSSSLSTNNSFFYSAVSLSHDHNAREPREKARLAAAHPGEDDVVVCKPGNASACYVKGRLQPTRSLGDGYLKDSEFNVPARIGRMWGRHIKAPYTPPYVSAHAELSSIPIQIRGADSASFLILACDGVWDELSSEEAVAVVADHVQSAGGPHRATPRDLEGAAEKIKEAVLQRAAEAEGMSVEQLRQMRPGKEGRRGYHDDITALVVFFGSDYTKPFTSSHMASNNNSNPLFPGMTSMHLSSSSSNSKWWPF